jgi:acyl-CoA thioesterase I
MFDNSQGFLLGELHKMQISRSILSSRWFAGGLCWLAALNMTLCAGAQPIARGTTNSERRTVVVLGDSLAAGHGLDLSEAFPAQLQKLIDGAGLNCSVINAGLSGDTTAGGLRRIDWLLKRKVDVLVLELGGNDGLRGIPVAVTQSNLQGIIDRTRAKYPAAKIVIAGMQMPPNMGEDYNAAFQRLFPELALKNHAALVPFVLEGVGGKASLNQPDGIHPTAEGHILMAQNVWKILKPLLQK